MSGLYLQEAQQVDPHFVPPPGSRVTARGHAASTAWLALGLLGWTPMATLSQPTALPEAQGRFQVKPAAWGGGPNEAPEGAVTTPCPALRSPRTRFSLGAEKDEGGEWALSKKGLIAVFVSLTFETLSVRRKVTE